VRNRKKTSESGKSNRDKEIGDMAKVAVKEAKKRYCYAFEEGDGTNKKLLGGKGAGLCTMTQIGLPVPPGRRRPARGSVTPPNLC
jgi:hypothetical protein